MKENVLIIGAGKMAIEYGKVLLALKVPFVVAGRGETSAKAFEQAIGVPVILGGATEVIVREHNISKAIVSVPVEILKEVTQNLMNWGIREILCEKPGGLNAGEIGALRTSALETKSNVYIAYNRRFYASTRRARKIIKEDGGATSFVFEFTEWSHKIEPLVNISAETKRQWVLANSSHVIDLAFFLGGEPKDISGYTAGKDILAWHPNASIYAGAGVTDSGVPFSYHADWQSAGRWGVEILTNKHRLILRPLEKLFIQDKGSIETAEVPLDDSLDTNFKPGFYRETSAFLTGEDKNDLMTIEEQVKRVAQYARIDTV